jgi:anti-anti-sigma factor
MANLVIRAYGDLDIASAKALEDELRWAIDSDASAVVLDLAGLTFIDSTGLRALLLAAKRSAGSPVRLSMVRAPEVLQNLIQTTGVEDLLPLAD